MTRRFRTTGRAAAALALITALAACSSSGSTANRPAAKPKTLHILVTNDDGFDAPGIDVVTEALRKLPQVKVTVVAPATNKSGTGSQTTTGDLTATQRKTASGYPATAVDGFPSDAVRYALETMNVKPDVVVSGINAGQNLGPITGVSGTVGAAKAAASRGIPAIASSQGLVPGTDPQYIVGAGLVIDWVRARWSGLLAQQVTADVVNLNIPTCASGRLRGVKQAPLATDGANAVDPANCDSTVTDLPTDVAAFHNGYASVTELTKTGQTVTTSTTWPSTGPPGPKK